MVPIPSSVRHFRELPPVEDATTTMTRFSFGRLLGWDANPSGHRHGHRNHGHWWDESRRRREWPLESARKSAARAKHGSRLLTEAGSPPKLRRGCDPVCHPRCRRHQGRHSPAPSRRRMRPVRARRRAGHQGPQQGHHAGGYQGCEGGRRQGTQGLRGRGHSGLRPLVPLVDYLADRR